MIRLHKKRNRDFGIYTQPSFHLDDMGGEGFFSAVKDRVEIAFDINNRLNRRPKEMDKFLKKYGHLKIVSIQVCRTPIKKVWTGAMALVSMGEVQRRMAKQGFDKFYHLFTEFKLSDGTVVMLEKNARVTIKIGKKIDKTKVCTKPLMYNQKTLLEFWETVENANITNLWWYSAWEFNCQRFQKEILNANGIFRFNSFIIQILYIV
jgi:hypothetical protein